MLYVEILNCFPVSLVPIFRRHYRRNSGDSVSTYNSQSEYDSRSGSFDDTLGDTMGGTFTDLGF